MRCFSPLLLLAAAGCATTAAPPPVTLAGESFGPSASRDVRTLVLILHGDGDGVVPAEFNAAARAIADAIPGARAVALLRPGYADAAGNVSPGTRGGTDGDSYTADRVAAVADAVAGWRARYPQARTILVGQSGGAAMAATLMGVRPGLVDGVVLAGCPCMLPEWRKYRAKQGATGFGTTVNSFDPLQTVGGIAPSTRVTLLVGAEDKETPLRFSRGYAEALALRGIATDYRVLPGRGHDLLRDGDLIDAVRRMAAAPPATPQRSAMVTP
ncbi:alpha/beta hydrolase family protein [Sphingomonas lacusdianchii]|uniref:alpha/beta hydrolase family protein n=1 Tax=Sphingomonas lacusdianchii TaxID=2917992 RepID=UPI001F5657DB|nr:alpha/beta fold hydrolase [Sphingomonas sp. JXJ CY 53]